MGREPRRKLKPRDLDAFMFRAVFELRAGPLFDGGDVHVLRVLEHFAGMRCFPNRMGNLW